MEFNVKADLDFAVSYRAATKRGGSGGSLSMMITVLVLLAAIFVVFTTVFFVILNINDGVYIGEMRAQLATYALESNEIAKKQAELTEIEKTKLAMADVNAVMQMHRMLNKDEVTKIYGALDKGVWIDSVKYKDSVLELTCKTLSVYGPSNSADNLNAIGVSAYVAYGGFTYEDKTDEENVGKDAEIIQYDPNEPKTYVFGLVCSLNATEGGDASE